MKANPEALLDRTVAVLASCVYFVQGALGISAVAFPLFLRARGWSISEIATFSFISGLPWTLKLLYGALSDGVPLWRLHRKPYVVLASLLSVASWAALALLPHPKGLVYGTAILANLGFAVTDVVTDALIVENATEGTAQLYQSLAWGFRSFGAILGGFLGGYLAEHFPYRLIFGLTGVLPLMTVILGFFIHDVSKAGKTEIPHPLRPILESLRALFQGDLKWFCLLMFTVTFSAAFSTPFFFFMKERLAFRETFLGLLSSLSWVGAMAACIFYGRFLKDVPARKMLVWAICFNAANVLTTYFIVNPWSAALVYVAGGVMGYLTLLPILAAATLLARKKGIEGALFALLMSVHNLGVILATFIGGKLFDIIGLESLIFFSAIVGLIGLVFVRQLRTL